MKNSLFRSHCSVIVPVFLFFYVDTNDGSSASTLKQQPINRRMQFFCHVSIYPSHNFLRDFMKRVVGQSKHSETQTELIQSDNMFARNNVNKSMKKKKRHRHTLKINRHYMFDKILAIYECIQQNFARSILVNGSSFVQFCSSFVQ